MARGAQRHRPDVPSWAVTPLADLVAGLDLPPSLRAEIDAWLTQPRRGASREGLVRIVNAAVAGDTRALDELRDAFSGPLPIGTGGRRGKCGPGPNRFNESVLGETARGLAAAMTAEGVAPRVAVAYDTRRDSRRFAHLVADELACAGLEVVGLDQPRPTPQLSYLLRDRGCGAGVMISASHNPPEDNGIKIYGDDGAQVLGERDRALMHAIQEAARDPRPFEAPSPEQRAVIHWLDGDDLAVADRAYHTFVSAQGVTGADLGASGLGVVFTPLHGVGHTSVLPVLAARGLDVRPVEPQLDPDGGRFSTVESANPEVPASLSMALDLARETGADLVLATDPDADRLGAAVRDHRGGLVPIDGNRLGAIMLDHVLRHEPDPRGWVLTTLVTTPLIRALCEVAGVDVVDDLLVGFKHHAGLVREHPTRPLLLGCEESHGYVRGNDVRDKDGAIGALLLAECAAEARREGHTLLDRLRQIWLRHGYHRERTANIRAEGARGRDAIAAVMSAWRGHAPQEFGGLRVHAVTDRASGQSTGSPTRDLPGNVLVLELNGDAGRCRLVLRPSGTEPKLKVYALASSAPASAAELDVAMATVDGLIEAVLKDAKAAALQVMVPYLS